jgi:hypothetical protein
MSLKFTEISETRAHGSVDGAHHFSVSAGQDGVHLRFHNWSRKYLDRTISSANDMRAMVYEGLARYREFSRAQ